MVVQRNQVVRALLELLTELLRLTNIMALVSAKKSAITANTFSILDADDFTLAFVLWTPQCGFFGVTSL